VVSVIQLGTIDYATGLRLQEKLVALRKEGRIGDTLLLLEHTPVITLGRNAKSANIIASPELLAQRGVELRAPEDLRAVLLGLDHAQIETAEPDHGLEVALDFSGAEKSIPNESRQPPEFDSCGGEYIG